MTQAMRERVMGRFRKRKVEFLVATDVAARGLDVDDIEVVFNYDLPHDGEDYVHRIGRTGRAGQRRQGGHVRRRVARFIGWKTSSGSPRAGSGARKFRRRKRWKASARPPSRKRCARRWRKANTSGTTRCSTACSEQDYSPTDIASALIHLLGEDKTRAGQAIPEDRPRPDYQRQPDSGARERRERGRDEFERPPRERAQRSGPREEAGMVSHEAGMVRLAFNVGRAHAVLPGDFVGVIAGVTAIPKGEIGAIHLQATKTLVDVAEPRVALVLKKLNGIQFKGRKLAVRVAK